MSIVPGLSLKHTLDSDTHRISVESSSRSHSGTVPVPVFSQKSPPPSSISKKEKIQDRKGEGTPRSSRSFVRRSVLTVSLEKEIFFLPSAVGYILHRH